MSCRKIIEEFVLVFGQDEAGRELRIAIHRHVSICPQCAENAEHTRKIVTVLRERCIRAQAPNALRERILAGLRRQH